MGASLDKVLFSSVLGYYFSRFSLFMVHWHGVDYATSEHAYQAAKFSCKPDVMIAVQKACSVNNARKIAQENDMLKIANWLEIRLQKREDIERTKLQQYPSIQKRLLATGDAEMIDDSSLDDTFWGVGPDEKGENHMGKIWMKLREEMKAGK